MIDRNTLTRIAVGALTGAAGGLAASLAMNRFQALTQPSDGGEGESATERAADAVALHASGSPLSDAAKPAGGQMAHYSVGAALGAGYGVAAEFLPRATAGAGTAFATVTWALLDEAAVPAAGFGAPPWKSPPTTHAYGLASHLVFGLATEMTRRLARRAIVGRSERVRAEPGPPSPSRSV